MAKDKVWLAQSNRPEDTGNVKARKRGVCALRTSLWGILAHLAILGQKSKTIVSNILNLKTVNANSVRSARNF